MINGREAIALAPHKIAHLGVAYCPEERGIYASLSTEETSCCHRRSGRRECQSPRSTAMFPNLQERRASRGTHLSGGEQQMLALARILRTGARLLLLDEISEGLAPVIVQALSRTVHRLREQGYTIVMVEQNFPFRCPAGRPFLHHGSAAGSWKASRPGTS